MIKAFRLREAVNKAIEPGQIERDPSLLATPISYIMGGHLWCILAKNSPPTPESIPPTATPTITPDMPKASPRGMLRALRDAKNDTLGILRGAKRRIKDRFNEAIADVKSLHGLESTSEDEDTE